MKCQDTHKKYKPVVARKWEGQVLYERFLNTCVVGRLFKNIQIQLLVILVITNDLEYSTLIKCFHRMLNNQMFAISFRQYKSMKMRDRSIAVQMSDGNHSHAVYQNLLLANRTFIKT